MLIRLKRIFLKLIHNKFVFVQNFKKKHQNIFTISKVCNDNF